MVIGFAQTSDWPLIARLYEAMQEELDLPAPAVSVSARCGYQVWISLADPVTVALAHRFMNVLINRCLAELPRTRINLHPSIDATSAVDEGRLELVPAVDPSSGKWSTFIDPSLGALFVDEPWLDMAPSIDKQANLLAELKSINAGDLQRVLELAHFDKAEAAMTHEANAPLTELGPVSSADSCKHSQSGTGHTQYDPKTFLLAVMNDASVSTEQRIEAAKALLPYFEKLRSESST